VHAASPAKTVDAHLNATTDFVRHDGASTPRATPLGVTVARRNGSVALFSVTRVSLYPKSTFPTSVVYGNIDYPGLRLITCGGLNAHTGVYDDNTVVFARLVGARHRVGAGG
jgi:hypothetical protein